MTIPNRIGVDYRIALLFIPFIVTIGNLALGHIFITNSDLFLVLVYSSISLLLLISSIFLFFGMKLVGYLSSFFVFLIFLLLFFLYTGELFEFTGSDSVMYYAETQKHLNNSLVRALQAFVRTTRYGWDDSGMIAYMHFLYAIYDSIILHRIANFLLLIYQAGLLRAILKKFRITEDLTNLTIALFSTNSAILYFSSSGLKETIFTTLVIITWHTYFIGRRTLFRKITLIISTISLYFFRIPEFILMIISLLSKQSKKYRVLLVFPVVLSLIAILFLFKDVLLWYAIRGEQDVDVARNMGKIYRISVMSAGLFGPFGTFSTVESQRDTLLYSMGLSSLMIMRVYTLLSIRTLLTKCKEILPLIVHVIAHIVVLVLVDRTLKIRYWMPALPAVYICFAYLVNINERRGRISMKLAIAVLTSIIWLSFWNILRYN
jgi:hypothetical protein